LKPAEAVEHETNPAMKTSEAKKTKTSITSILLLVGLHLTTMPTRGAPGDIDPSFQGPSGGWVESLALQADNKILIGGELWNVGNAGLARLDANGAVDRSFKPKLASDRPEIFSSPTPNVRSIVLQPDGKILICGRFVTVNGVSRVGIARLNQDGTPDAQFDAGGALSFYPLAMLLQNDGKLLVGLSSNDRFVGSKVARLDPDGTLDSTFAAGEILMELNGRYVSSSVRHLALQSDSKILIGGTITIVDGITRNRVARLHPDGSLDHTFDARLRPGDYVNAIVVDKDGKVLIAGTLFGKKSLLRLHPDGSPDSGFDPPQLTVQVYGIASVALETNGKIIVGGDFLSVNGQPRHGIARLNLDGSLDSGFDWGLQHRYVSHLALYPDDRILVWGAIQSTLPNTPYLLRLQGGDPLPVLSMDRHGKGFVLSWPAHESTDYVVEFTESLAAPVNWNREPLVPTTAGDQFSLPIENNLPARFYRLRRD
jgi:uncharacterized delta-60 repeat protein